MHNNQRQTAAIPFLYMNFRSIFIVAIDYKPLEQTYVLYNYISSVCLYNFKLRIQYLGENTNIGSPKRFLSRETFSSKFLIYFALLRM